MPVLVLVSDPGARDGQTTFGTLVRIVLLITRDTKICVLIFGDK